MRRAWPASCLALTLANCAPASPVAPASNAANPQPSVSARRSSSEPTAQPSRRPTASESQTPASDPSGPDAGESPPVFGEDQYHRDTYYAPERVVDLTRWLEAHAVPARLKEKRCWDAADRVGVPPAPG